MRLYEPPAKEFFRLPNSIFHVPLDATQFKLYAYLVCCSGSKGYCWPTHKKIIQDTGIKKSSLQKAIKALVKRKLIAMYKHRNPYGYEEMERKLKPLAEQLGIADILIKYPYEVSGGQKQRAAVARALITDPQIVLADEPTGALDSRSSDNLLELFGEINKGGQTILMVTHSVKAASHAGRVLFLRDGRVYHQLYRGSESREAQFRRISDTLTVLTQGGENHG